MEIDNENDEKDEKDLDALDIEIPILTSARVSGSTRNLSALDMRARKSHQRVAYQPFSEEQLRGKSSSRT